MYQRLSQVATRYRRTSRIGVKSATSVVVNSK
jgi:hypothetical protein